MSVTSYTLKRRLKHIGRIVITGATIGLLMSAMLSSCEFQQWKLSRYEVETIPVQVQPMPNVIPAFDVEGHKSTSC